MKNALLSLLVAVAVFAFFSFADSRLHPVDDRYTGDNEGAFLPDTVPYKKDTGKQKSRTVPYDSFGKPKKMDTTRVY